MYRFTLESKNPLTGKTEKGFCPQCGKKQFVRYWDNVNQCFLPPDINGTIYGRCDRENSCQYWVKPTGESVKDTIKIDMKPHPVTVKPKHDLTDVFKIAADKYTSHTFKTFLTSIFDAQTVESVLNSYGVTGDKNGSTIFWRKDWDGTIVTGKCIAYNTNGHRKKEVPPYWVHSKLIGAGKLPKDYQPEICLFGIGRAARMAKGSETIYIVESEKTAIIAECYGLFPNSFFCATGGATCTGYIVKALPIFAALGCPVVLVPDTDGAGQKWSDFASQKGLRMLNTLHDLSTPEQRADGYDLGDLLTEAATERPPQKQQLSYEYTPEDFELYFSLPY